MGVIVNGSGWVSSVQKIFNLNGSGLGLVIWFGGNGSNWIVLGLFRKVRHLGLGFTRYDYGRFGDLFRNDVILLGWICFETLIV